ncbi:MAG: Josephin-domain-containing protein [Monoraphidium minutum]|nr:MAG: Josephin-domain-containing protein [Monoraphidium minutum]
MWLYHEKQEAALCGVHCINTLLQGHYFSELDLAEIARELDRLEREVMGGAGLADGEHGNLDDSGMFSSQVLSKALELWQLEIVPFHSQAIKQQEGFDPVKEAAFICNRQEHWYALRRVTGQWWNLNSLLPAPEPLSDFYLAAYLDSLVGQGYTLYVVKGALPAQQVPQGGGEGEGGGRWFTPDEARDATKEAATARQRGKANNAIETALARAAEQGGALTLQPRKRPADAMAGGAGAGTSGGGGFADEDPELAAALAASLQDAGGGSQGGGGGGGGYGGYGGGGGGGGAEDDEDFELAAALAASMEGQSGGGGGGGGAGRSGAGLSGAGPSSAGAAARQQQEGGGGAAPAAAAAAPAAAAGVDVPDEPEEGAAGALTVALRLPGGVVSRRWRSGDTVAQLRAYAAAQLGCGGGVVLCAQFPRRVLSDDAATLAGAGVEDRSVLTVSAA